MFSHALFTKYLTRFVHQLPTYMIQLVTNKDLSYKKNIIDVISSTKLWFLLEEGTGRESSDIARLLIANGWD